MLDTVTFAALRVLAAPGPQHRVSILLPTSRSGPEVKQGPLRLKKLVGTVSDQLVARGLKSAEASAFLAPATALIGDDDFWANTELGLALFIDRDGMRRYRVGHPLPERGVVANDFQLRSLIPAAVAGSTLWVLAISQAGVRLFHGQGAQLEQTEIEDMPEGIDDALRLDDRESTLQSHSTDRTGGGRTVAGFHGQGAAKDTRDDDRARYCRIVDGYVVEAIGDSKAPIVLAGERRLVDEYRKQSRLMHLVDGAIIGNPDTATPSSLGAATWPIVEPVLAEARRIDWKRFDEAIPDRRTSSLDIAAVAALDGRVASMSVPLDLHRPGRLDAELRVVADGDAVSGDVYDAVVAEVLRSNGRVYAAQATELPGAGPVAALFRF